MTTTTDDTWGKERVAELRRRYGKEPRRPARAVAGPPHRAPQAPPAAQPRPDGTPGHQTAVLASDHQSEPARAVSAQARAGQQLEQARWAARAFGTYPADAVRRIVEAVAAAAAEHAQEFAERAVAETGFGVVEHKVRKNLACSVGLLEHYAGDDYVTPRVDDVRRIVEVPRPAGVVLALTPSTNPVATTYFKAILALMTRNAVIISPHPMAKGVCAEAAHVLARAAEVAGAPAGIIQVVEEPTIPLVESLMADPRTNVVVATGGTGVVRAAYSSGNPALGVGPGNVPVLVDATADIKSAARAIVESKAFDNSVLCTNESVLIVEESVADELLREMERAGAQLLTPDEVAQLSAYMFPMGRLNTSVVGRDAAVIAADAGLRSSPGTKVLLAPFTDPVPEEMMTHEKLSPVLGVLRVPDAARGVAAARSIIRIAGAGHSAAIHSTDPTTIMEYGAKVPVLRISVNVGNSTGSSGLDTHLAPTMTIGTGFIGRSSIGENLEPRHLLNWVRMAYDDAGASPMPDFTGLDPWRAPTGPVPAYPRASNETASPSPGRAPDPSALVDRVAARAGLGAGSTDEAALRAEIRRLVAAELSHQLKG